MSNIDPTGIEMDCSHQSEIVAADVEDIESLDEINGIESLSKFGHIRKTRSRNDPEPGEKGLPTVAMTSGKLVEGFPGNDMHESRI